VGEGRYRIPLAKTIAISGSIERKGSRTDTKVYGARVKADHFRTRQTKARRPARFGFMRSNIDVMRLDRTLGQSRHVACASSCMSIRTSLEEGIKLHRFAGFFPEQFLTEAGRHREAVVAADQRIVIRCYRDDLAVLFTMSLMCPPCCSCPPRCLSAPRSWP
jgi:hypothetical protein